MIRQTSIDVYHAIEAEGLLSKRRLEVYKHLFFRGPLTQREVTDQISDKFAAERSYTPRFAELLEMKAIMIVGERECSITGRNVYVWDVTGEIPKKLDKNIKPTRNELISALCDLIETMKTHLDSQKNVPEKWVEWSKQVETLVAECKRFRKKKKVHH